MVDNAGSSDSRTDLELLAAYAVSRDQVAFELIVKRHTPRILLQCRMHLRDFHDAEDAAQAVFATLAQNASKLNLKSSLVAWLCGVAKRVCMYVLRARQLRERHHERLPDLPGLCLTSSTAGSVQRCESILEELLISLPEKYRIPIILHHVEGRSFEEVGIMLGCKPSTVSMRITRGCEKLRKRFENRNVVLSVAGMVSLLSQDTWAMAPSSTFVQSCSQVAMALAENGTCADVVGANVQTLMKGVQHMMFVKKLKLVAAACLALALVAGGLAIVAPPMSSQASAGPNDYNNPIPQELRVQIYALLASTGINADSYTKYEFFKVSAPWGTVLNRSFQVHLVNSDGSRAYFVFGKQVSYKSPQYVTYIYDNNYKVVAGPVNIMP